MSISFINREESKKLTLLYDPKNLKFVNLYFSPIMFNDLDIENTREMALIEAELEIYLHFFCAKIDHKLNMKEVICLLLKIMLICNYNLKILLFYVIDIMEHLNKIRRITVEEDQDDYIYLDYEITGDDLEDKFRCNQALKFYYQIKHLVIDIRMNQIPHLIIDPFSYSFNYLENLPNLINDPDSWKYVPSKYVPIFDYMAWILSPTIQVYISLILFKNYKNDNDFEITLLLLEIYYDKYIIFKSVIQNGLLSLHRRMIYEPG